MNGDLISRSELLKHGFFIECEDGFYASVVKSVDIRHAPAVDAVVPVRCNDCDHCLINLKWNTALCMRDVCRVRVPLDGFCNFGVPRGAK